jgi:hypothetical protein
MNNKYPYAATAALKGVSFLDSFFHEDSYDVGMMSLAWDQRLLRWDLKIKKPSHSSDPERKQFQITRSLFSSLSQIAPYQNQYEYYFNSPSFIQVPKEEMEAVLEKSSKLSEENIQFSFNCGIVVYISEIASLFTIKTQSKEGQGSNWLCTAVGEGFEVIQFIEN